MSIKRTYSDEEILSHLNEGGRAFENVVNYLNITFSGFINDIQSKVGLSREKAVDAYTDAILKLIRQVKEGKFKGESKLSTYFYKIFYYTAVDISRKKTTNEVLLDPKSLSDREASVMNSLSAEHSLEKLKANMKLIGKECLSILVDWAYGNYSMKEIAQKNNLKNEESARSMKYKCLKKLKSLMRN